VFAYPEDAWEIIFAVVIDNAVGVCYTVIKHISPKIGRFNGPSCDGQIHEWAEFQLGLGLSYTRTGERRRLHAM